MTKFYGYMIHWDSRIELASRDDILCSKFSSGDYYIFLQKSPCSPPIVKSVRATYECWWVSDFPCSAHEHMQRHDETPLELYSAGTHPRKGMWNYSTAGVGIEGRRSKGASICCSGVCERERAGRGVCWSDGSLDLLIALLESFIIIFHSVC